MLFNISLSGFFNSFLEIIIPFSALKVLNLFNKNIKFKTRLHLILKGWLFVAKSSLYIHAFHTTAEDIYNGCCLVKID